MPGDGGHGGCCIVWTLSCTMHNHAVQSLHTEYPSLPVLQAYLSLISTLSGPSLEQLQQLPPQWVNTLQYAWEQDLRDRKKKRHQRPQSSSAPSASNEGASIGAWELQEAHRHVCMTLDSMGFPGAQVERYVKVAGFLIEVDVTLQVGGHAVALLLDGPCAYTRGGEEDRDARQRQPRLEDTQEPAAGTPRDSSTIHGDLGGGRTAAMAASRGQQRRELLGQAIWRQQLLQRMGWIVVRLHWHDWAVAAAGKDADRACLLSQVLKESGLITK